MIGSSVRRAVDPRGAPIIRKQAIEVKGTTGGFPCCGRMRSLPCSFHGRTRSRPHHARPVGLTPTFTLQMISRPVTPPYIGGRGDRDATLAYPRHHLPLHGPLRQFGVCPEEEGDRYHRHTV